MQNHPSLWQALGNEAAVHDFTATCPQISSETNPYRIAEAFFGYTKLHKYKAMLYDWFKYAMLEDAAHPVPSSVIFLHVQLTELLQAGYMIGNGCPGYNPSQKYGDVYPTFAHWLLLTQASTPICSTIQYLEENYVQRPVDFCRQELSLEKITQYRAGMQEWLCAALNAGDSIQQADAHSQFTLYETLHKTIEVLFLLMVAPAQQGN